MRDPDCVAFLQWALPRMRMRWAGFRKVRRQVCKRIARRLDELHLADLAAYRTVLGSDAAEWERLDTLCRVTISRFYRDRAVWDHLGGVVLPDLMGRVRRRGDAPLRCWSVGCASGEEPYTLALVAAARACPLRILATEADERLLDRARRGVYGGSSLRDLPDTLRGGFSAEGEQWRIDPVYREPITFVPQDVRNQGPAGDFHLVLCRNLVFTYYDESLQAHLLAELARRLVAGGILVIGIHEALPAGETSMTARQARLGIYAREAGP